MPDKVRLGIIGLGQQGGCTPVHRQGHGPEHGRRCDLRHRPGQGGTSRGSSTPTWRSTRTTSTMLDSGDVDAVVTCVPHYLHPEMGIAALAARHPRAGREAGGRLHQAGQGTQRAAATKPELTFGIMFNQRNNPLYRRIKEIVDAGEIGKIRRTNWIITTWWRPQGYYDSSAWRATWGGEGGGVLVNQAPHQLDLWQWICGVPKSVYAKVAYGFGRQIAVEDEVTALRRLRRRRHRHVRHRTSRPRGHRPIRDPRRPGQDRRRGQQDGDGDPAAQAGAGAERQHGHGRRDEAVHGSGRTWTTLYTPEMIEFESAVGRTARRRAGELRPQHPRRHPVDRPGIRRHQRGPAGQRHPPVELDRQGGLRWTSTRTSTWPCSTPASARRASSPSGRRDHGARAGARTDPTAPSPSSRQPHKPDGNRLLGCAGRWLNRSTHLAAQARAWLGV